MDPQDRETVAGPVLKTGTQRLRKLHEATEQGTGESILGNLLGLGAGQPRRALPGSALLLLLCVGEALQGGTAWYSDPQGAPP